MKNIVLIGMPGCGKSTIGEMLSERIKMTFIDIDAYIETSTNLTIGEIFKDGETVFRDLESTAVAHLSEKNAIIISTGGGVIKRHQNMLNLKKNGIIIYINRPIENIVTDIDVEGRPLLAKDSTKLYRLFDERNSLYKRYCDHEVINIRSMDEVVNNILQIYSEYGK